MPPLLFYFLLLPRGLSFSFLLSPPLFRCHLLDFEIRNQFLRRTFRFSLSGISGADSAGTTSRWAGIATWSTRSKIR